MHTDTYIFIYIPLPFLEILDIRRPIWSGLLTSLGGTYAPFKVSRAIPSMSLLLWYIGCYYRNKTRDTVNCGSHGQLICEGQYHDSQCFSI